MSEPIRPPRKITPPVAQQPVLPQEQYYNQPIQNNTWNMSAIVAFVSALLSIMTVITSLVAIISGHIALSQIKKTGQKGKGLAIGSLVFGYLYVIIGGISLVTLLSFYLTTDIGSLGIY